MADTVAGHTPRPFKYSAIEFHHQMLTDSIVTTTASGASVTVSVAAGYVVVKENFIPTIDTEIEMMTTGTSPVATGYVIVTDSEQELQSPLTRTQLVEGIRRGLSTDGRSWFNAFRTGTAAEFNGDIPTTRCRAQNSWDQVSYVDATSSTGFTRAFSAAFGWKETKMVSAFGKTSFIIPPAAFYQRLDQELSGKYRLILFGAFATIASGSWELAVSGHPVQPWSRRATPVYIAADKGKFSDEREIEQGTLGALSVASLPAVSLSPGTSVAVSSLPSVTVSSAPSLNIGSMPAVSLASGSSVSVTSVPAVSIASGSSISVTSIPAVQLAAGQSVGISSLPSVNLASGTSVSVSSVPAITVASLPAVSLAAGTSVEVSSLPAVELAQGATVSVAELPAELTVGGALRVTTAEIDSDGNIVDVRFRVGGAVGLDAAPLRVTTVKDPAYHAAEGLLAPENEPFSVSNVVLTANTTPLALAPMPTGFPLAVSISTGVVAVVNPPGESLRVDARVRNAVEDGEDVLLRVEGISGGTLDGTLDVRVVNEEPVPVDVNPPGHGVPVVRTMELETATEAWNSS